MAQLMNETQRLAALEAFNPKDHLIQVGKDRQGKATMYYPAAWRLYELNLRYPNANFKSEIIYHNEEKGTVIVKAYLYLGKDYESSDKKAEAMKQGNISSLDKVETAAKARAARDFGIGTEYALDMVPDETDATHDIGNNNATTNTVNNPPADITEQQVSSIRKLCLHLNKKEPDNVTAISYIAAKRLIQTLTAEYREAHPQGNNKAS